MMPKINYLFSKEYLYTPIQNAKYNDFYLYLSILLITLPIVAKIVLLKTNRPKEIYKNFDSIWFWGSFSLGILGLFIWFSRTQTLPLFSTRFVSYLFLFTLAFITILPVYYYLKKIPQKTEGYYKNTRKKKYLT